MPSPPRAPLRVLLALLVLGLAACTPAAREPAPPPATVAIWGSSSAERIVTQGGLAAVLGVPVYGGGVGGEVSEVIAARQGGDPAVLTVVGGTIPASGGVRVTASLPTVTGVVVPGTLGGVAGTLVSAKGRWYFDRREPGPVVGLTAPTPLVSDASTAHAGDVTLLWMGKNDVTRGDWQTPAATTRDCYAYAQAHSGRVLVLGHFANADMGPGSTQRDVFDRLQQAYVADYGTAFVDVQAYVVSGQVWTDLHLTPTAADLRAQQRGTLAPSLGAGDGEHLSAAAYHAVAEHLIRPRLLALGWIR